MIQPDIQKLIDLEGEIRTAKVDGYDMGWLKTSTLGAIAEAITALHADAGGVDLSFLRPYGWAPGNYMATCGDCRQPHIDTDKLSRRCIPCALRLYRAASPSPGKVDDEVKP